MKLKVTKSKNIFQGKIFDLRQDQIEMPNGNLSTFDILEHPGAVVIIPKDDDKNIWLVRQYRHAVGGMILELPAGTLETNEEPIDCANREIQEEIGMRAKSMIDLGKIYNAPGYSTEIMQIFFAENLSASVLPMDEDEIIEVEKYSINEIKQMIISGEIVDAKTIAGIFMLTNYLENLG
jgi:ADP-ribose pyrophosphatase